jgi:hypothetical protein
MVTLTAILLVVLPGYITKPSDDAKNNPYYETDTQIEAFEQQIDDEDIMHSLEDYSL